MTFGLAATLAGAAMAQYPYTIFIQGTISGCYPGQTVNVQTVQGTQPAYDFDVPVEPGTCSWSASLGVSSNPASFMASTLCNGMMVNYTDSVSFNFIQDSAYVFITFDCGGDVYDCNGVLNGPALPGTACDDGDVLSTNDAWQADCSCAGTYAYDCEGVLNGPAMTGTPCDDGDSLTTGDVWSIYCDCIGDSSYYDSFDCLGIFLGPNMPGTACDDGDPSTLNDVWSSNCYCAGVNPDVYDCLGIVNGPDMPGTPCVYASDTLTYTGIWNSSCVCWPDSSSMQYDCLGVLNGTAVPGTLCVWNNQPGTWSADCVCNPDSGGVYDCLWVLNGPNMPGTACIVPGTILEGTWSPACVCVPDSSGFLYDCNGVLNGPDMPGMPCDDSNPATTNDTWNSACVCVGTSNEPCTADFWVIQAMGSDSIPIPYELWVWNLSSGGSQLSYSWDFGDGTSSTEAFPTHTYSGNGPYLLCLTVADNNNCTETHCDSISINADGVYEGMVVHADDRQDGFTINVQAGQSTAVQEVVTVSNIATWPNPAVDELNVAVVSEMQGFVTVTITDLDGRTVRTERTSLGGGRSQLRIATSGLNAGMYLLRISDGTVDLSQRFVKVD